MADKEVFVEPVEQIKPVKKKRVMSEARKAQLKKQLADARLKKKLLKDGAKEVKKVKEEPVNLEEPVKKEEPVKLEVKEEPVAVAPSESAGELVRLKKELADMKSNKKSNDDMDEIRDLKEEMKEIRDAAKLYKQQAKAKKDLEKRMKETPVAKPAPLKVIQDPIVAPHPPQERYSTYKKSIWSRLL